MEYPLISGGEKLGRLIVTAEGLYTIIEAELPGVHQGMHRIWLHGGGKRAYLGLMQPWSGGMYLRRKLSRSELSAFPQSIEYASDGDDADLHNTNDSKPAKPEAQGQSLPCCPLTPQDAAEEDGLQWFSRPDGSLAAFDGAGMLIALPARLRSAAPGVVLRRIGGREYMLFRY